MATELSTMTCPRCGTEIPTTSRFCPACGLSLTEAPRAERRIVTVLFGDLTGFTEMSERLDAEEVKAIVDRAFEGLAELVTLYGGSVDKIVGDEIMAVFGAPQAHEDDPERAVRCALEMQRSLVGFSRQLERERSVKLAMRIGVNTGEVVAGVAGGGGDAYTVIGDAVNATKRIETSAQPGQVLVGERTYLATASAIEYRVHEPIVAKGKSEPLAVWEAHTERALPGQHLHRLEAPIIGRDEELEMLEAFAAIVRRDRRAAVATLLGGAGMGKSRLAEEFARRLEGQGVRILAGRSLPYGTASPSFAVEEMVRAALDVEPGAPPDAARSRAAERIASLGLLADLDRLLALAGLRESVAVREPGGTGVGPGSVSTPAGRGSDSLQAAAALFETLADQEELLVLSFQELHWAEDSLIDFVSDLVDRARSVPLLVVCLARPELAERRPGWAGRPGSLVHVLNPLPRDRAGDLLDALSGGRAIHPAVRESLLDRAGGNPFFIEELVRLLLDRGGLPATESVDATASVPGTVQALVSARLDALAPNAKRVAQTASVIGDEFWTGALEGLEPDLGKAGVTEALQELEERELIALVERPSIPGERAFTFRQTIVREVAYGTVPKQVRARQHAALGGWLEHVTTGSDLEREFADLVAHHYERAARLGAEVGADMPDAREKARQYLERAGEQAISLDAASAAADFFQRALEFARDESDLLHLRLHLGEALVGYWRPVEAELHLTEALQAARRVGERRSEAKALRLLGDLSRMRGDIDEGRKHLGQALEIARAVGDRHEEAAGVRSHGLADLFQGRLPSATAWFDQALATYRELGDRRGEGWCLNNLAWVDLLLGRLDEAHEFLGRGLEIFSEIGDAEGVGWCLGLQAWVLLFQGKLSEAEALERQIESMITQSLRPTPRGAGGFGWAIGRILLAFVALDRGRLAESEEMARQGIAIFAESDATWGLAMGRFPLGMAQLFRRMIADARATFAEGAEIAEQASDPMVRALIGFGRGLVEFEAGELERAERLAEEALRITEDTGVAWISEVPSLTLKAGIHKARGEIAEARALLENMRGEPMGGLYEESQALAILSELYLDEGRVDDAIATARRGIEEAGEECCSEAVCHRALARALAASGDREGAERQLRVELDLLGESDWDEERVRALVLLGEVLDSLGRRDEAGAAIEEARELVRRFPLGADVRPLEALLARR